MELALRSTQTCHEHADVPKRNDVSFEDPSLLRTSSLPLITPTIPLPFRPSRGLCELHAELGLRGPTGLCLVPMAVPDDPHAGGDPVDDWA